MIIKEQKTMWKNKILIKDLAVSILHPLEKEMEDEAERRMRL
jgi:hypothetical protein